MKGDVVEIDFEAWQAGLVGLVAGDDGALEGGAREGGLDGIERGRAAGGADHVLDRCGAEVSKEDDQGRLLGQGMAA